MQHESDCRFTFDFTQVYWNSRLHTEHDRLIQLFKPEDIVVDVFAGVGPFAVPAGAKGCGVLANDLNPNSAKYLKQNVEDNRVNASSFPQLLGNSSEQISENVRVYCEDGRDFIHKAAVRCFDEPFAPYTRPRLSRMQEKQVKRKVGQPNVTRTISYSRRRISHFVMNLPDSAITFLDAFRGILVDDGGRPLNEEYEVMPMVHCHCFTRELEPEAAERDIRKVRTGS